MCLENVAPRCARLLKAELRLRLLRRQLDHIHFVQLLLTGHRHIAGCHTRLVARNKILQIRDLLLLLIVCSLKLRLFHLVNFTELIIVAYIAVELLIVHVIDQIDHAV